MIIFSLIIFPSLCIFINSILDIKGQGFKFFSNTYLKGIFTFLPALLLMSLISGIIKRTNTFSNIYLYHFIYDFAVYYALINFGYTFLFKNSMIYRFRERISEIFTYECGFFSALAVFDALYMYKWESPYVLFILPCSRLAMVLIYSMLPPLISESSGFIKYIYILSMFILPFAVSFIAFFYYINSFIISIIILCTLLMLSSWLFYYYSPVIKKR